MRYINIGEATLIPGGYFPDDLDTTALGLLVFPPEQKILNKVLNQMALYVTSEGSFLVCLSRFLVP